MRSFLCVLALLACLAYIPLQAAAQVPSVDVIPEPQQVTRLEGVWAATDRTVIVLGEKATADDELGSGNIALHPDSFLSLPLGINQEKIPKGRGNQKRREK